MITIALKKQIRFAASVAALLTVASTTQAAPASAKKRTVHVHEIHREANAPRQERPVLNAPAAREVYPVRSHAELEMINPG